MLGTFWIFVRRTGCKTTVPGGEDGLQLAEVFGLNFKEFRNFGVGIGEGFGLLIDLGF